MKKSINKVCAYCGDLNQCRDHVIPISYQSVYRFYKKGDTVPACNHCNTILGNKAFHTIDKRAEYISNHLLSLPSVRKKLKAPRWNDDELLEMGEFMVAYIKSGYEQRVLLERRLDNLELAMCGFDVIPIEYDFFSSYQNHKERYICEYAD